MTTEADWTMNFLCKVCGEKIVSTHQPAQCPKCKTMGTDRDFPTVETDKVAQQNDLFRRGIIKGMPNGMLGTVVATVGINAEGRDFVTDALIATAAFEDFSDDNDPMGARDFGVMEVRGKRIYWKIDLYDLDLVYGSPAPSDLDQTRRILTLLFPSEY